MACACAFSPCASFPWPFSLQIQLIVMLAPTSCGLGEKGANHPQLLVVEIGKVLCSPLVETSVRPIVTTLHNSRYPFPPRSSTHRMSYPQFLRSFIADVFTSMPKIFTDVLYTTFIFTSGTAYQTSDYSDSICKTHPTYLMIEYALKFLPYWVRLMQSIRGAYDSDSTQSRRKQYLVRSRHRRRL